jgi:hypothetical protein
VARIPNAARRQAAAKRRFEMVLVSTGSAAFRALRRWNGATCAKTAVRRRLENDGEVACASRPGIAGCAENKKKAQSERARGGERESESMRARKHEKRRERERQRERNTETETERDRESESESESEGERQESEH